MTREMNMRVAAAVFLGEWGWEAVDRRTEEEEEEARRSSSSSLVEIESEVVRVDSGSEAISVKVEEEEKGRFYATSISILTSNLILKNLISPVSTPSTAANLPHRARRLHPSTAPPLLSRLHPSTYRGESAPPCPASPSLHPPPRSAYNPTAIRRAGTHHLLSRLHPSTHRRNLPHLAWSRPPPRSASPSPSLHPPCPPLAAICPTTPRPSHRHDLLHQLFLSPTAIRRPASSDYHFSDLPLPTAISHAVVIGSGPANCRCTPKLGEGCRSTLPPLPEDSPLSLCRHLLDEQGSHPGLSQVKGESHTDSYNCKIRTSPRWKVACSMPPRDVTT
ncbi:uncharacterized protein LOC131018500 [Salvia miltiorrhiza]|uniref:uncharacterized protein LOC131018500 n=1 Tax=Salvia miltiorrhiza TaxID=226208 RepID=UPI0025ACB84D|nr:uncharacterized protein LOC131018500 [Salvia miltiorrhiza]